MDFQTVPTPTSGKRWAIPDVHGCGDTLKALIEQLHLSKKDQLFCLGDYVDRGGKSKETLDLLIDLTQKGYQVYPIKGNHDQDLIDNFHFFNELSGGSVFVGFRDMCIANRTETLLDAVGRLLPKYANFLMNLPYYLVLEDYYVVHAGFAFESEEPFEDYEEMLWKRKFSAMPLAYPQTQGRRVIVGHDIQKLQTIQDFVAQKHIIIPLDNGCFMPLLRSYKPEDAEHYGNLCAFNLDDFSLLLQPCIDTL